GAEIDERDTLERALRFAIAGYRERESIATARIENAARDHERALRPDVRDELSHVPAVHEEQHAIPTDGAQLRWVADAEAERRIVPRRHREIELRSVPDRASGSAPIGYPPRLPVAIDKARQMPAATLTEKPAVVRDAARGIRDVLAAGVALNLPANRHRKALPGLRPEGR